MRYVIRKEFFGGLVYDRKDDINLMIDEDFYQLLEAIQHPKLLQAIDAEKQTFLRKEGFIKDKVLNYKLIDSGFVGDTLSAPGRVHFYYTSKCNLNCKHCFTKDNMNEHEMSFKEKIEMLNQMQALGINEILIGGGEPFICSDFLDFVEECLNRDIITKIFSNGLLLGEKKTIDRMAKWDKLRYLSISVDGSDEVEYERIRGRKGLDQIRDNLIKIKESCVFEVTASVTVNSFNYTKAEPILTLIDEMGFDRLKVRPVKPGGNVYKNPKIFLDANQYAYFIKCAQKFWNQYFNNKFSLDFSWGDSRLYYNTDTNSIDVVDTVYPYEGYGCFAGKVNIVFDSGGNAITCGFLPSELARDRKDNLKEKTIKEIWENGKKFVSLRNLDGNSICINCKYYSVCRGGCIARNLFYGKTVEERDPWCLNLYFPIKID